VMGDERTSSLSICSYGWVCDRFVDTLSHPSDGTEVHPGRATGGGGCGPGSRPSAGGGGETASGAR